MRVVRPFPIAALALALLACSSEPEPQENAEEFAARIGSPASPEPADKPSSSLDPAPKAPMARLGAPRPVPAKFQGTWDFVDSDCSARSDLRIRVGTNSVQFHETAGVVNGFEQPDENSVILNLAMEGEGERWEERFRLALVDGGRFLEASEQSGYGTGQAMRRKRCG